MVLKEGVVRIGTTGRISMHVLIIGGTGPIGIHVIGQLAGAGHQPTVYHRGETERDLPAGSVSRT